MKLGKQEYNRQLHCWLCEKQLTDMANVERRKRSEPLLAMETWDECVKRLECEKDKKQG